MTDVWASRREHPLAILGSTASGKSAFALALVGREPPQALAHPRGARQRRRRQQLQRVAEQVVVERHEQRRVGDEEARRAPRHRAA